MSMSLEALAYPQFPHSDLFLTTKQVQIGYWTSRRRIEVNRLQSSYSELTATTVQDHLMHKYPILLRTLMAMAIYGTSVYS